ncbi:LIM domain-containing protein [Colossoma macropomum]|uniref:LIM domain-containing protein n=1 Tax=Colossoma macropomum TaxID=42526 RepID=UPI0018650A22|nr:LIM domain-containing protein [Colossoma macropomum]
MEVKSSLRRAQSLKSVSTDHSLSWTEAGLRDRRKSVSQLVAQYQNSISGKARAADSVENKQKLTLQFTAIPVTESETKPDTTAQNNESKERPRVRSSHSGNSPLTRSKSMEILPRQKTVSTSALRELYESKVAMQSKSGHHPKSGHQIKNDQKPKNDQQPRRGQQPKSDQQPKSSLQPKRGQKPHNDQLSEDTTINHKVQTKSESTNNHVKQATPPKEENLTPKVVRAPRAERRKTVTGVYTEKVSSPEDDKRKSDFSHSFRDTLYGQEKSPISVKAISALYLSKVAAADPTGNLLKPEQDPTSPARPKVSKMADVAQKDLEQHDNIQLKEDVGNPILQNSSRAESLSPIPTPPAKEAVSTQYQQRQKCELRRLLKHTCPELKGLGTVVDEEFADILNSGIATDTAYGGEVQSRRWIFENGAVNTGESYQTQTHWMEKSIQGEHVFEQPSSCLQEEGSIQKTVHSPLASDKEQTSEPQQGSEALAQEENFRVDVKATRKMFEGQSTDALRDLEDVFSARVVVSEEEKGAVQKQKRDFETYQNDTVKRISPLNITDLTDMGQDGGEAYLGISKAKEIFEKGSQDKENSSPANENVGTEDEILKTNVRNRAQMFESTPLDRINWQNVEELDTMEENMSKTLASLHNFNVIHSHGILIEASEAGHVRKAMYNLIQDKGPEIQHEETVMGSMKSILLQLLARANLNSFIAYLKEDDQGNMEIKNVEVPTHQLPFTVHQDKEYRTTIVVQVIEDLLGQETSLGKGVLIQECDMGSVETLVFALFRHDGHDATGQSAYYLFGSGDNIKEQTSHPQLVVTPQKECEAPAQEENFRVDVKATRKMFEGQSMDTFRDNLEDAFPGRVVPEEDKDVLLGRKGDDSPNMYTPPPPIQDDDLTSFGIDKNRTSNVKLFRSCIEKGELDYLKRLQRSPSDEDLSVTSEEREQNPVIVPGNLKMIKELFTNTHDVRPSLQSDNPVRKELKEPYEDNSQANENDYLPSPAEVEKWIAESENVEPGRSLHYQDGKHMCSENTNDGMVLQAELVNVAEDDELSNLQAAILSLQQATEEAKALQQSIQQKQQDTCAKPTHQIIATGSTENQNLTEAMKEDHFRDSESTQNFETGYQQEEREEAMKGSVQAALDSLGKSSFNVTKGDFRAAMIYRNSGKAYAGQKKTIHVETAVKQSDVVATSEENKACLSSPLPGQVTLEAQHEGAEIGPCQGQPTNNPTVCPPLKTQAHPVASVQSKKTLGPKPAIPPKPDHLKVNLSSNTNTIPGCATNAGDLNKAQAESNSKLKQHAENETVEQQSQGHINIFPEGNATTEEKRDQTLEERQRNCPANLQSLNEPAPGFQTALQNFGMKTGRAAPPVKPKRIKMATNSSAALLEDSSNDTPSGEGEHKEQPKINVIMREKKVKKESEEERRQRLSVHMDEIMRGNASAALEIFDQLRKQEELKNILSKVEEIEEETSQEHVSDLQKIFENVPDWVVPQKSVRVEEKEGRSEMVCEREMMSSMQVAYGDLEKASAAIITLKEQTLSRLMDIEETIKKALYSVSTLKSDSDIAGLSGLFKESMMAVHSSPISGNIRKISIGSSKSPRAQNGNNLDVPEKSITGEPAVQADRLKPELSLPATKPRSSSPSSPSFISIQSAARKNTETPAPPNSQRSPQSTKTETFQSTTCYNVTADRRLCCVTKGPSCSPANERRQVSTLEVQTIPEGEKVIGTKTIREKYEEMDCFGNKFYSSKTSTVMTTQPETSACFRSSPATSEVVTFPRINIASVKGDPASS